MYSKWQAELPPRPSTSRIRPFVRAVAFLALTFAVFYHFRRVQFYSGESDASDGWCPLPPVVSEAYGDGLAPSSHLMGSAQRMLQSMRLSAAIQVPTESFDDNGDVDVDPRWKTFDDFHQLLADLFPRVHAETILRKPNRYGLCYTWPGSDSTLRPILFMAHQDVVPAGSAASWTYPPFAGHDDGAFVWGRGAADCKNVLIGVLSVLESLLAQAFTPQRTIVLAFGFDEETGGMRGATHLSAALAAAWKRTDGGKPFVFILDEGGMGVVTREDSDVVFAYPGVGEKGYCDLRLTLTVAGGHSSRPPAHTGIGIMADAVVALEQEPFLPQLTQDSPFRRVLECQVQHTPDDVPRWLRLALQYDGAAEIAAKLIAAAPAAIAPDERWLMQTSQAVDVVTGGVKVNALPEKVELLINYRVALHQSISDVVARVGGQLQGVVRRHGLVYVDETNLSNGTEPTLPAGTSILRLDTAQVLPVAPLSPTLDSPVWDRFAGTLRAVFETTDSGRNKTVVPVGSTMTGNTDTVHYWPLSDNIYRFTPSREGARVNAHATNERMEMTAHLEGMRVYYDLIRNFDHWND